MRVLESLFFLALHAAAGFYAVATLGVAWNQALLLQLLLERLPLIGRIMASTSTTAVWLAPIALAFAFAGLEVVRTARRWRQAVPEPEVGLRLRVLAYLCVGCVAFNAFVLSTPETFSGPFRQRFPIYAQLSLVVTYDLYALWWMLLPRLRERIGIRVRHGLDLIGMNALLVLVFTELALRGLALVWSSPLLITAASSDALRRESERNEPGAVRYNHPVNQGGHYDGEFLPRSERSRPLVANIGDSFSYGVVPHAYHYTTVAERALGSVDVYNIGFPGLGPSDYLYLLEEVALPLEPDLIVVQLFAGNDVVSTPSPAGPARWFDADRYLSAVVWFRLGILRRAELAKREATLEPLNQTLEELTREYPWLADPLLENAGLQAETFLGLEAQNAFTIAVAHVGVFERFFAQLEPIERSAGSVPLVFVLIPDEFQVEDDLWEAVSAKVAGTLERDLAQRKIVAWMTERGRPVLDLLPLLRAVEPLSDGRRHLYHLRDTHFNARGNDVAGRALADFVAPILSGGFPAPPMQRTAGGPPPTPVALPLHLALGDDATRAYFRSGWSSAEVANGERFAWNDGPVSVLSLALPPDADVRMDFRALPFEFRGSARQRVAVVVNGAEIGQVDLKQGLRQYSVTIPAAALRTAGTTIEFRYAYARAPRDVIEGSLDERPLAVAWQSIAFEQASP